MVMVVVVVAFLLGEQESHMCAVLVSEENEEPIIIDDDHSGAGVLMACTYLVAVGVVGDRSVQCTYIPSRRIASEPVFSQNLSRSREYIFLALATLAFCARALRSRRAFAWAAAVIFFDPQGEYVSCFRAGRAAAGCTTLFRVGSFGYHFAA